MAGCMFTYKNGIYELRVKLNITSIHSWYF